MRRTSPNRVAESSRKSRARALNSTLYSKKSYKYTPKEDEIFARGKRVPTFTVEEANERGLFIIDQLAEQMGRARSSIFGWLNRHDIQPAARVTQPKYGHHLGQAPYLYALSEVAEMWKKCPLKKRS